MLLEQLDGGKFQQNNIFQHDHAILTTSGIFRSEALEGGDARRTKEHGRGKTALLVL